MPASFSTALKTAQSRLETVLDTALPKGHGPHAIIHEAMRYAALGGGKRFRPALLVETVKLFRALEPTDWRVAAAVECIHVYSLIHDDLPCMDDDDLRRGKPTVHKAYDQAIAVLAGDGLQSRAFELMADADLRPEVKTELILKLAKASGAEGMVAGQVIDMTVKESDRDQALISTLQSLKTGALIEYAVQAGAILGGASTGQERALRAYAADIGLAFQITDDILDVEGDAKRLGKAVGKDKNLGKATFVSILGLKAAKEKAANLGERAKRHLEEFGNQGKILCDGVDFVLRRTN